MDQRLRRIERAAPPGAPALDMFALDAPLPRPPASPSPAAPPAQASPAAAAPVTPRRLPSLAPVPPAPAPGPAAAKELQPKAQQHRAPEPPEDPGWAPFAPLPDALPDGPDGGDTGPRPPARQQARPAPAPSEEISGKLVRLIFPREAPPPDSDAFRVYSVKVGRDELKMVTTFPVNAGPGDVVTAKGTWTEYRRERRFRATIVVKEMPREGSGVILWLKNLNGVGAKTADKIVRYWALPSPHAKGDPEALVKALEDPALIRQAGVPQRLAEFISESWRMDCSQRDLVVFLGNLQLNTGIITRIIRTFGTAARSVIESNPWRLAETIDGIAFPTADAIARRHGHALDKPERIRAALRSALREAVMTRGHCGLPVPEMVSQGAALLGLSSQQVQPEVDAALDGTGCLLDPLTGLASPKKIHRQETEFAERLLGLLDARRIDRARAEAGVAAAERDLGLRLDPSQRAAALLALTNNVAIITGGPGTGKSTTMKVVLRVLKDLGRDVVATAPTGRAAKRLQDVTGVTASTCHRLLSFEDGDFAYGPEKPFKEDAFVVDESSMMDVDLGHSFVSAIKPGSILTFVGDVDQLPSVGPGQVLRDMIASGAIPTAKLEVVHRQHGDSGIVTAARRINAGEYPLAQGERLEGFSVSAWEDPQEIVERIVHLMTVLLPARGFDPLQDIQVLAAQRKGAAGVVDLNRAIKRALNPPKGHGHTVTVNEVDWSVGDRVMQNRNNYAKEVYNGEIGTVTKVGQREARNGGMEDYLVVNFGQVEATYGRREVDEIEQAYATTVHKSQGCEFPVVLMACPASHGHMLDRNLLYTAVTRAKKGCIVVGEPKAVARAVAAKDKNARYTGLAVRLAPAEPAPPAP